MLVLERDVDEKIIIQGIVGGERVRIVICLVGAGIKNGKRCGRIGIDAPRSLSVDREEVAARKDRLGAK